MLASDSKKKSTLEFNSFIKIVHNIKYCIKILYSTFARASIWKSASNQCARHITVEKNFICNIAEPATADFHIISLS